MTYNWYDYLIFSRNLKENPSFIALTCQEETIKRNIVSRAYYAAFHHSKKFAETQRRSKFPTDDVHNSVKFWFKNNGKMKVFNDLRELSTWRNKCDYEDHIQDLDDIVKSSLKGAERVHHYF